MIGYYIHHRGSGHLIRAHAICAELELPVTALSSLPITGDPAFDETIELAPDNLAADPLDPTATGALHWAPRQDNGLRERMAAISNWIAGARPQAIVVDVSVEVAMLARLHGIPVIVMTSPGSRTDPPHQLVHRIADRLVAAWPNEIYDPAWLWRFRDKTTYVGGISRFATRVPLKGLAGDGRRTILVLGGCGGNPFTAAQVRECAARYPQYHWRTVGLGDWVDDVWPLLQTADVIVAPAGQGAVADIAAARRPALLIPATRPFDEQATIATAVAEAGLAVTIDGWPDIGRWPELVERALDLDPDRWRRWCTHGAAARAAAAISAVAAPALVRN